MANANVGQNPPASSARRALLLAARGASSSDVVQGDRQHPNQQDDKRHRNTISTSFSAAATTSSPAASPSRSPHKPNASSVATLFSSRPTDNSLVQPSSLRLESTSTVGPRNQAPGIIDRRKSVVVTVRASKRQDGLAQSPTILRSRTIYSMPGAHKKEDSMGDTSGAETFEDAHEANRDSQLSTADSDALQDGQDRRKSIAPSVESQNKSSRPPSIDDLEEDDDAVYQASAEASKQHSRSNTLNASDLHNTLSRTASPPKPLPLNTRDRSISPTKLVSGQISPKKVPGEASSGAPGAGTFSPSSNTDRSPYIIDRTMSGSPTPPAPGFARKASAGFAGFLGRMGRKQTRSPSTPRQPHERRGTTASMTSVDSSATGFGEERRTSGIRPSLQDQFKSLRSQQEEHGEVGANGHVLFEGSDDTPRPNRFTEASPISPTGSTMSYDRSLKSPPLNPTLPPGTAQGVAAGPPREEGNVDWNLWQSLVYEGPAALARSSGEDLNRAIASGIPQAIRGVVWQVLAESKNEELEVIYRTLRGRGSGEADQSPKGPPLSRAESVAVTSPNGTIDEETTASTPISTRGRSSNGSTPPTGSPSRSPDAATGVSAEVRSKLMAEKHKREAATMAKLEKMIKRDMGSRTSYSKYVQSAGLQEPLFGVCKAYALFDEGVGYAQGINFIAMPLLFYMAEEEAFTLLVRLMSKYDVRSLFTAEMPGLHKRLYQFERLLEDFEPALYCHLKRRNVSPQLYATQWFLTLFTYRFPLQLTTRVYDLIFAEGLTAVFKFAIALMQHNRETLLEMKDMSQLTTFLKEKLFDVYIDKSPSNSSILESSFFGAVTGGVDKEVYKADEMVRDACDIKISEKDLVQYAAEWEEQQRVERERQEEVEKLRHTSSSLAARVKVLESQTQQQDTEHVAIAGDLVRIKVENERLLDENEGLKFKVEELQRMVDQQPAEVEAKLKQEMDRIMQRNIEVQNENRATKEEMDELESELVRVKMAHAETLSEHEALKQKWSGVQALLK